MLLNDPTYVEAARKLAERTMLAETDTAARIELAFRIVLSRLPSDSEQDSLKEILADGRLHFTNHPGEAVEFLKMGETACDRSLNPIEVATWTTAMSVLLNLDETFTRE